jgi:hypothetical protein
LFSKNERYFYDAEAVKMRPAASSIGRLRQDVESQEGSWRANGGAKANGPMKAVGDANGRNRRDADWWIESLRCLQVNNPVGFLADEEGVPLGLDFTNTGTSLGHYASYPVAMVEPWVKAMTSEAGVCGDCGAPHERIVERVRRATRPGLDTKLNELEEGDEDVAGHRDPERHVTETRTVGWRPTCGCGAGVVPAVVYDPFGGAQSTTIAALSLERRAVTTEIGAEYVEIGHRRVYEWRRVMRGLPPQPEVIPKGESLFDLEPEAA